MKINSIGKMNLDSSINFNAQTKLAPTSPKMSEFTEKCQRILKNSTNAELTAGATSLSAGSVASLATKFPYIAAGVAALQSLFAGAMYTDARAVKKDAASTDIVEQIMKYVDWVANEYANKDYSMIEAYLVASDFDEEVINLVNENCIRNYTKGVRPAEFCVWNSLKLVKYIVQDDDIVFTVI